MSYWFYFDTKPACGHCGRGVDSVCLGNATSNLSGVWGLALFGDSAGAIESLEGKTGAELLPVFERAVAFVQNPANWAACEALLPKNGWGERIDAETVLETILKACREYPAGTFVASG